MHPIKIKKNLPKKEIERAPKKEIEQSSIFYCKVYSEKIKKK